MGWRRNLILFLASAAALAALGFVSSNTYMQYPSAQSDHPDGVIIMFRRPAPNPWGYVWWFANKPLLLVALGASAWYLYRFVWAWRAGEPLGRCRKCGYDIRATPERCPECGTVVEE